MMDLAFFADMAWKSALIAGAALALAAALRSRSAADRTLVLRIGVIMLLALPVLAMALPALEIAVFSAPEPLPALDPVLLAALAAAAPAPAPATIWDDPTPLVLLAYCGGLAWVATRLLAGLVTLRRWTRAARPVTCPAWLAAFERVRWQAADGAKVRLLVSEEVQSPLSWGWRHPTILINTDTLRQPGDAEAILAHEIAHAARRDWPALVASRLATALFWFNPMVWLLEREAVQQAEEAADVAAAERVEPARYAETLLAWARTPSRATAFAVAPPATSIAPSARALGRRVRAILDGRRRERPSGSAWTAAAILACIGVAAPVAAMQLVAAAPPAPAAPVSPVAPAAPSVPAAPGSPAAPQVPAAADAEAIVIAVPDVSGIVDETLAAVLPQIPAIVAAATAAAHPHAADADEAAEAAEEAAEAAEEAREDAEDAIEDAREEMRRAGRAHAPSRAEMERIRHQAVAAARAAPRAVAIAMAHSAEGMLHGAQGMEQGARGMAAEADRLQDRAYRERMIAEARARGETLTHERLLHAAERLREGSVRMREGAREMRQAAVRMRAGRHN